MRYREGTLDRNISCTRTVNETVEDGGASDGLTVFVS